MSTIKDVAKMAGVSTMTVSRVLNNASNVSPATRQTVQQAIDNLGYVPSGVAKSLRSKRTQTLALLVPDSANSFWTSVARGVEDAAQSRGYSVVLCNTDEDTGKQQRYLDVVISQQVDGVIIAPCDSDAVSLSKLRRRSIPTAVIDRHITGWNVDTVIGDSIAGARALVRHLIGLGHRRIAYISGPVTTSTAHDRFIGYQIALDEAGIKYDARLYKCGEYRAISGEQLTHQLLDEGLAPTAIFAANNALMIGAINALGPRGLRVPEDIAMVCFGDLLSTSHFFPFLTVADIPSYEMGVNAVQLLLSRLDAQVAWKPRHVVLPARLIIRHSCGSRLDDEGDGPSALSVPVSRSGESQSLVKAFTTEELRAFSELLSDTPAELFQNHGQEPRHESDIGRLLAVLGHQESDRVPFLEFEIGSRPAYKYILERELGGGLAQVDRGAQPVAAEDRVEFAQRLGMDAIVCDLAWQPNGYQVREGAIRAFGDLQQLEPPWSLTSHLDTLEQYLRAARGTGVGVVAGFPSFFGSAMQATGITGLHVAASDLLPVKPAMDVLLSYWERIMRAVCDRFASDVAFVLVGEDLSQADDADLFRQMYEQRMERLISPAKEHSKLVVLDAKGPVTGMLPLLHGIGFDAVRPRDCNLEEMARLKEEWAGQLAFIGGFPTECLAEGTSAEIENLVKAHCSRLGPGGGYVLSTTAGLTSAVPPENLLILAQAMHRYGRFELLMQGRQV